MAQILVVDDEKSIQEFFAILLRKEGWSVDTVASADAALGMLQKNIYDLVITDLSMPGMTGLELLRQVKQLSSETAVVLVTAYGTAESAVAAMKEGAADYLLKPFKVDEITLVIRRILQNLSLAHENQLLKQQLKSKLGFGTMIGVSAVMQGIFTQIQRHAQHRSNVLITGPSGTGKELVARAIHDSSPQHELPFVSVNCGAIPENLLESELFGHMRGAFTGAVSNKRGLLEVAGKGTFFFDEIGELPLNIQVKLLRVLQERCIRRVGGTEDIALECRVIAATNKKLEEEVAQGRFREDLFYRLNVFAVQLPALKERRDDIAPLVEHCLRRLSQQHNKQLQGIRPQALQLMQQYDYPGNVRELENIVEQAVAMASGDWLEAGDLPAMLRQPTTVLPVAFVDCDLDAKLAALERDLVSAALAASNGVMVEAAKRLKISFRSLRYRLRKMKLSGDFKI